MLLALLCGAGAASAHGLNTSYIDIAIEASRLSVTCLLSADEIIMHFPVGVGAEGGGRPQDLDAAMQTAFAFLDEHLSLTLDGKKGALGRKGHRPSPTGTFVRLELGLPVKRAPADITIEADAAFFERFGAQHINLVKVTLAEGPLQQTAITADRPRASFVVGYKILRLPSAPPSSNWASSTSSSGTTTSCSFSP